MTNTNHPEAFTTHRTLPRRVRRVMAAGWVSFLAAAAGLAPSIAIVDTVVEVTGGHQDLPVPLSLYSLLFLTLWATALAACLMAFLLQIRFRNRPPSGD